MVDDIRCPKCQSDSVRVWRGPWPLDAPPQPPPINWQRFGDAGALWDQGRTEEAFQVFDEAFPPEYLHPNVWQCQACRHIWKQEYSPEVRKAWQQRTRPDSTHALESTLRRRQQRACRRHKY